MPSPVLHFQIGAADAKAMAEFCREVFDWEVSDPEGAVANIDTHAREIDPNDIYVTGSIRQLAEGAAQYVSVSVRVADLDATIERAVARGAELLIPRRDREGEATVALIRAPSGHAFTLIQL